MQAVEEGAIYTILAPVIYCRDTAGSTAVSLHIRRRRAGGVSQGTGHRRSRALEQRPLVCVRNRFPSLAVWASIVRDRLEKQAYA